ncbi:MAG: Wzy polymerase domain-containing protein, partial [Acinetobacter sp.]
TWWLWKLHRSIQSPEALVAILMVGCVLIHAMFEFPQNYAYFLLPVGFLLGLVQASLQQKTYVMQSSITTTVLLMGILLYGLIWRDYITSIDAMNTARKHTDRGIPQQMPYKIYVLDQFQHRAEWYYFNRFSPIQPQQLNQYYKAVAITPTHYDLFKYAQILANNGQLDEAKHQLQLIHGLYRIDHNIADLFKRTDENGNVLYPKAQ